MSKCTAEECCNVGLADMIQSVSVCEPKKKKVITEKLQKHVIKLEDTFCLRCLIDPTEGIVLDKLKVIVCCC